MNDDKKMKFEIKKPPTVKDYLKSWADNLIEKGQVAFWPSWAYGTYTRPQVDPSNLTSQKAIDRVLKKNASSAAAQENSKRLATRKFPDVKKKVVQVHGRNVLVDYDRKKKGYFEIEDNHLPAITNMMAMPRNLRRNLARLIKLPWAEYLEAEAMIREG